MDPFTIAALVMGAGQLVGGIVQRAKARKRREEAIANLGDYQIPGAVKEQIQMAKEQSTQREMPGRDIALAAGESDIAETISRGEGMAESASDLLGLYAKAYGAKNEMRTRMFQQDAAYAAEQQKEMNKALQMYAAEERNKFDFRYNKFLSEMGYAGQLSAGGAANIAGGVQSAGSTLYNQHMMNKMQAMYKDGGGTDNFNVNRGFDANTQFDYANPANPAGTQFDYINPANSLPTNLPNNYA